MSALALDWAGVLTGAPALWIASGLAVCARLTLLAGMAASVIAIALLGLRVSPPRLARALSAALIDLLCNTPLLIQIFFWYFAAYPLLPDAFRDAILAYHGGYLGDLRLMTPEFICSAWALAWFGGAFIAEELRSGLLAVSKAQYYAALSLGFRYRSAFLHVLFPQALQNAWQPIVGQYLNLMKLSSLASTIGLAELTYRVREVEAFNAHAFEAYAVGSALYLLVGLALAQILLRRPRRLWR